MFPWPAKKKEAFRDRCEKNENDRQLGAAVMSAFTRLININKTTDLFVFAELRGMKVQRLLQYGTQEQHRWSKVTGKPQAWEAKAFDAKVAARSKVLITDAIKCAALAITAAYDRSSA